MLHALQRLLPGVAAYPSIHPLLVHFPVALMPTALLFAVLSVGPFPRMHSTARLLLFLGTLGMLASAATGLRAQQLLPHGPGTLVSIHRTIMVATGSLAVLLCLFAVRSRRSESKGSRAILTAGLIVVNTFLVLGADRGALVSLRLRTGSVPLPSAKMEGPSPAQSAMGSAGDSARGGDLYMRLDCASCHGQDSKIEAPGIPPSLEYAGDKLQADWIQAYLLSPHRIRWIDEGKRPVLRMPDFQLLPSEAMDLAAFLSGKTDSTLFPSGPMSSPPLTAEEVAEGRALVEQYACKGCHSIGGVGTEFGPTLDGVGSRLRPAYMYAFLKRPKTVIPGTPMKDLHLWDEEARSIAAYLSTLHRGR